MYSDPTPIENTKVLISLLVADNVSKLIGSGNQLEIQMLKKYTEDRSNYYKKQKLTSIESMVSDRSRLERLYKHRWFVQTVPLKYVGTWPGVGDLPESLCDLSVIDVSTRLDSVSSNLLSVQKIHAIKPYVSEILQLLPPILVMGGEVRNANSTQLLPFDTDDGSHRCIAAALAGIKKIDCYVGLS